MPDFPQELIDAIVEDVPYTSLAACSLTATAFVAPGQRGLFRWMSLSDIRLYERAAQLLASSPHLGRYVRMLALNIGEIPKDYIHLKAILPLFSELERLSIGGNIPASRFANQMDFNPCLYDLFSIPTLRCLALDRLVFVPLPLISRALVSFEQVILSTITVVFELGRGLEASSSPGSVWHLSVRGDEHATVLLSLLHPTQIGTLQKLQRLSIVIPPIAEPVMPRVTELLVACSPTLQYLAIELEEPPTYLPALPDLKELELWIDVESTKTPTQFHSIISGAISSTPHLEVLTIAILDRPDGPHRPNPQQWTTRRPWTWVDLDSLFVDSDMPNLREVHFSLRWYHRKPERYGEFVPFIQNHLPRTFDAGLIKCTYQFSIQHPMDNFVH
ncbi:hypothetical protein MVEN_00203300 [Mycena venus]|uniref:F-box domain-containing protein n=1 Tax=Mycena venus TaxID=2733690 RepID=A0A8H6Z177_9AGAR|nr:hypothetical protein MVEN_00203300 [Mycena venus]